MGACSGVVRSGKLLISAHFRSFLSLRRAGAGMRGSRLHGNDGGVARSGELLTLFRFVPFRSPRTLILTWIPAFAGMTGQGAGMRGSRLHGNYGGAAIEWRNFLIRFPFGSISFHSLSSEPHPRLLPSREEGAEGTPLPLLLVFGHFGHLSHLCRARLFRSAQEWGPPIPWPDMARFGPIHLWPRELGCATLTPAPLPEGEGMDTRSRDARFPPSRERRGHSQQRRM